MLRRIFCCWGRDVNNDGSSMAGQEYSVFGKVADLSLPIFDIYLRILNWPF
ncbi:MAG: hypothetical protein MRQ13_00590 [Candidatus Midichloria sp.]|nr:hypothetical protein [Candidatus Midichloria sp.]